jgi:hypothetical protein
MASRRHVFISHHHADDQSVANMTSMLARSGYEIRNSSIRAKPANQARLDKGLISDAKIQRLLRMKMAWASTVIVVVGKETHARPWVDWEIRKAQELGKRIVGVYERGGTANDIPAALESYADAIVNWNADSIVSAVEGDSAFLTPSGEPRAPVHAATTSVC